MCSCLQCDETPRYLSKGLFHRFRCRRQLLLQNDLACFIQNTVERPAISQIQTDRQLLRLENFVLEYLYSASLFHKPVSFSLRFERVDHWERIASRWRPAFSSHLRNGILGSWPQASLPRAVPDGNAWQFYSTLTVKWVTMISPAALNSPKIW